MEVEPPAPITVDHVEQAKERLILARATHLDSLVARLHEERVHRVIEPLIAGALPEADDTYHNDLAYVRDLGLVAAGRPARVANPIYQEVIVRVLGESTEDGVLADPRSFVLPDGRLDFRRLLEEFADFWCEHGEILSRREKYHEVAPSWSSWASCVELKVWHPDRPDPLAAGLRQLDGYLDKLRLDLGTLVIFDRRPAAPPPYTHPTFSEERTPPAAPSPCCAPDRAPADVRGTAYRRHRRPREARHEGSTESTDPGLA